MSSSIDWNMGVKSVKMRTSLPAKSGVSPMPRIMEASFENRFSSGSATWLS